MSHTAKWSDWFDEVLPDLPMCPQPLATHHIRRAAIEFCERTLAWRIDMDPVSSLADIGEYDFEPETGQIVVRAMQVWYAGKRIDRKAVGDLEQMYDNWPTEVGTPLWWTQENPSDSLILVPKPEAALVDAITAKLAVKPARTATTIAGFIFEKWHDAIAHGAKGRLFALKKKPWTDGTLATYHIGQFDSKIASAALEVSRSFTGAPKRVRAHFF